MPNDGYAYLPRLCLSAARSPHLFTGRRLVGGAECRSMKKRCLLIFSLLVVALLVGGCGLWVRQSKRQYALNRQLIVALVKGDTKQALILVNAGANPNTRYNSPPAPSFTQFWDQLLHRSPAPLDQRPTAFMIACGVNYEMYDGREQDLCDGNIPPISEDVPLVQRMLSRGADLYAQEWCENTALEGAIGCKHKRVVALLLKAGAKINHQNADGCTPLAWAMRNDASRNERLDMAGLLLSYGADVNVQNHTGQTALHYAVGFDYNDPNEGYGDIDLIKQLLAHGGDARIADQTGSTPIKDAQEMHHPDLVALLREGGK